MFLTIQIQSILALGMNTANTTGMGNTVPADTDITMNMEKTTARKITAPAGMGTNMGMILGIRGNILMQMLQPGLNSPA